MSAITGIFYRDGRKVDPELIKKMNDRLSHRGPDGSAVWCEGSVALGHQMLWTTPESLHEKLPFHDEKAGLVITADARIDNRKELSEELDIEDKENVSDSYFILKAYEKWDEKCPEYLLGDFAFAIWDENEEKLFCARDHMGVKPFYYFLDDEIFIFSTEIKALFCVTDIPKEVNELQVACYLALVFGDERRMTFYEKILRLPAANLLIIKNENYFMDTYWKLDSNSIIKMNSDKEYENAFREIFLEAVNCRLRSISSVGSMLSGGLDSSSVACTAQRIFKNEKKLKTFSATFDSVPKSDECHYIKIVLSSAQFEPYFIKADKINPLKDINRFLRYTDQPIIPPNSFMLWNIYNKANLNKTRIVLDGFDGDTTVFRGNTLLLELVNARKWKKFFFELNCKSKMLNLNKYRILLSIFIEILIPLFIRKRINNLSEYFKKYGSKTRIISKDFDKYNQLIERINNSYTEQIKLTDVKKKHYYELTSGLIQYEMEILDGLSSPFSIEHRHPFYDKRLIEFCLNIPTEQKVNYGWDRYIMRRALAKIIPKEIQWRKDKGNLSFNFKRNFMQESDILEDIIFQDSKRIEKYVDLKIMKRIYNECLNENTKETFHLWNVLILSIWLKQENI